MGELGAQVGDAFFAGPGDFHEFVDGEGFLEALFAVDGSGSGQLLFSRQNRTYLMGRLSPAGMLCLAHAFP